MSQSTQSTAPAPGDCVRHPGVPGTFRCAWCGGMFCVNCCFTMPGGEICCSTCFDQPTPPPLTLTPPPAVLAMPVPAGTGCIQHGTVAAVTSCHLCGAGCCATCAFLFPGTYGPVHLCPRCAVSAHTRITPRRKKFLVASFVLAGWSTIFMGVLLSGALATLFSSRENAFALGIFLLVVMYGPAIAGTALGFGILRKDAPNPMSIWAAALWNALLLGAMVLLSIVGNLS